MRQPSLWRSHTPLLDLVVSWAAAVVLTVQGLILLSDPTFFVGSVSAEVSGVPYVIVNGGLGLVLMSAGLIQAAILGASVANLPGSDGLIRSVAGVLGALALIAFIFSHPLAGIVPLAGSLALTLAAMRYDPGPIPGPV